ncbi:hypothetical protein [Actinomadura sp. WMMA1423]|uniref:hypothetical protein n=1 Tax=Actinomadura sp. WMMA1423 TaxID=2591108 RepID=UPI0011475863|nr:hypothetical protein [Actinomadura sp. WMMA1423]
MIRNSRRVVVLAIAGAVAVAPVVSGCGAGEKPQTAAPTQLTEGVNVSVPKDRPGAAQIDLRHMFLLGQEAGRPIAPGADMALYGVVINQVKGRQDRLVSVSSPAFGGEAKIDGGSLVLPPAAQDGTGSFTRLLGKPSATPTPSRQQGGKKKQQPGASPSGGTPSTSPSGGATPEPTGQGATPNVSETPTSGNTSGPQGGGGPSATPNTGGEQPLVVLPKLNKELRAGDTLPLTMRFERAGSVEFQIPVVARQGEYTDYPLPDSPAPQSPGQTPGQTPSGEMSTSPSPGAEQGGPESSQSPTTTESPAAA